MCHKVEKMKVEHKGSFVILAAFENKVQFTHSNDTYGDLAKEFAESRAGTILINEWGNFFNKKQG